MCDFAQLRGTESVRGQLHEQLQPWQNVPQEGDSQSWSWLYKSSSSLLLLQHSCCMHYPLALDFSARKIRSVLLNLISTVCSSDTGTGRGKTTTCSFNPFSYYNANTFCLLLHLSASQSIINSLLLSSPNSFHGKWNQKYFSALKTRPLP